jgi:hypothetical protein
MFTSVTSKHRCIILINPLSRIVPYFIILLCLAPDDFTCQGESAVA